MNVFFTSDTHFSHFNIIQYCNRQFSSVEEMDDAMSTAWNETVGDDDILVHMGDLTLANHITKYPRLEGVLRGLKGVKMLVGGNHDRPKMRETLRSWGWIVVKEFNPKTNVKMSHYYPQVADAGFVHIHGHAHGKTKRAGCVDVGVDAVGFRPVSLEHVVELCSVHVPVDALLLKREVVRFVAQQRCAGVIPNTFVMCGEGEKNERFYCSGLCESVDLI